MYFSSVWFVSNKGFYSIWCKCYWSTNVNKIGILEFYVTINYGMMSLCVMYIVLMFTVPLLLIFSREIASATLLYVLGNGRISGCCRCLQLWWPHQRLLPLQLWWPRQRLLLPGESLLSRARVPQTAGKSSVRVCLPMRTLLLQTVYTHIISNDICMLVCMFELGFRPYKKLITRDRGITIDEWLQISDRIFME